MPAEATRWEVNLAAAHQCAHIETVTDTEGRTHDIRLGVFRSNTRTHHKKQKLTPDQMREATDIGLLA